MSNPQDQNEESTQPEVVDESSETSDGGSDVSEPEDGQDKNESATSDGVMDFDNLTSLNDQLEVLAQEVLKYKDSALRAEAEMQNLRRRSVIDLEKAHKFSLEKLIQNLLPVVDSLEKGIESAEQTAGEGGSQAIIDGVGLCHKLLVDVLNKEGLVVVDPQGEPFDPNLHQAMSMVENPDVEPNSVVAVMQKGYTLNSRLMRPAMVMVSKPAPKIDETA